METVRSLDQVRDRDFFSIIDENGEKSIHIHGYIWESDNDDNDETENWRQTDYTFCIVPLAEFVKNYAEQGGEYISLLATWTKQYEGDITAGAALDTFNNYYEGHENMDGVSELAYADITVDTPYGDYVEPAAFDRLSMEFMRDAVKRIAETVRRKNLQTIHCASRGDDIPVRISLDAVQVQLHGEWSHISDVLTCGEIITAACMDDYLFRRFIGGDAFRSRPRRVTLSDDLAAIRTMALDRIAERLMSGNVSVPVLGYPTELRYNPSAGVEVKLPQGWRDISFVFSLEAIAAIADSHGFHSG